MRVPTLYGIMVFISLERLVDNLELILTDLMKAGLSAQVTSLCLTAALQHITFYAKPGVNISVKMYLDTFPQKKKHKEFSELYGNIAVKSKTKNVAPS